jgi:hypothetical protein
VERSRLRHVQVRQHGPVFEVIYQITVRDQMFQQETADPDDRVGSVGHRVQWDQLLIIVRLGDLNDTGLLAHLLGLTLDRLEMDPALAGGALEICANGTPQAVNLERDSAAILLLAHSFRNVFVQPVFFAHPTAIQIDSLRPEPEAVA